MAEQIITIQEILNSLNGVGSPGPWIAIDGVYTIYEANIGDNQDITSTGQTMVLKNFINTQTGEIKSYLAKWTDEQKTRGLP